MRANGDRPQSLLVGNNTLFHKSFSSCVLHLPPFQGTCDTVTSVDGRERYWGCTCKPQFSGIECSRFECPNKCNWNGICLDAGICACYPGFQGGACERDCGE